MTVRPSWSSDRVAVIGDVNPDIVLMDERADVRFGQTETLFESGTLAIGGSGSITACACAQLGLRPLMVGAVGRDLYGDYMLDQLERRGVDVSGSPVLADSPTGFSVIVASGVDRAILTYRGAIGRMTAEDLPMDALVRARHVHIGSFFMLVELRRQLADVVDELSGRGVAVSLDTNWDPEGRWDGGLSELLPRVDVFLPNAAEALAISGAEDVEAAGRVLGDMVRTVAIKLGPEGALLVHEGNVTRHAGFSRPALDTTGAGDAFDAGFIRGRLSGWPAENCTRLANAVGALSTEGLGATEAQPDLVQVGELLGLDHG